MDSPQTVKDFFDPDRIYDLLYAEKIHPALLRNLANALGHHGIFDNGMPVVLVERMSIPSDFWAENWTGYLFEFLKFLSRTGVYANGDICGKTWGFDPPGEPNYDPLDLSDYYCPLIRVIIPPRTTGFLSWLERAHSLFPVFGGGPLALSAPYCSQVGNRFVVVMRRHREFVNPTDKFKEVDLPTTGWIHNSVRFRRLQIKGVNEDDDTVTLTEKQKDFLLYGRINTFLNQLMALMELSQGFAMVSCRVSARSDFFVGLHNKEFPWWGWYQSGQAGMSLRRGHDWYRPANFFGPDMEITIDNPGFNPLPGDYFYATLIRGIEIKGRPLTAIADNIIAITFWDNDFFWGWNRDGQIPPPVRGYTDPQSTFAAISVPYPYTFAYPLNIKTYHGQEMPFFAWPMGTYLVPYGKDFDFGPWWVKDVMSTTVPGLPITHLPLVLDFGTNLKRYQDYWGRISEPFPGTPDYGSSSVFLGGNRGQIIVAWEENMVYLPELRYAGVSFPVGDPHLFRDSVEVFFHQQIIFHYSGGFAMEPGQVVNRKAIKINHAFGVRTSYGANPMAEPSFLVETGLSTAQVIHDTSGGPYDEDGNFTFQDAADSPLRDTSEPVSIEGFIIVHRHFR